MSHTEYLTARFERVMKAERYEHHSDEELRRAKRRNLVGTIGGTMAGTGLLGAGMAAHEGTGLKKPPKATRRAGKAAMAGGLALTGASFIPAMRYQHALEESQARRTARRVRGE